MRPFLTAGAAALAVVAATALAVDLRRDREWQHGGDDVTTTTELALTTAKTFGTEAAVRLGVPPGEATRHTSRDQTIVVRVTWSGLPDDGSLQLMMMDTRVTPPRPLAAEGGWTADGGTGTNWAGIYEALPEHYDWMQGFASIQKGNSWTTPFPTAAVTAGTGTSGTATAWFGQWGDGRIPLDDPARELALALVRVGDDNEVRWAKRIHG